MFNTVPFNPFPPSTEQKGADAYELPIAGAETLGGVKVGTGLSINSETGVLSASAYELPIAGAETLGGVKVGTGLSINSETGLLSATSQTWDYSTSEVNTGQKWIDGKDIFCKVYNNIQLTDRADVTVDANFGSDKNIIKFEGAGHYSQDDVMHCAGLGNYMSTNDKAFPRVDGGVLKIIVDDNWSAWTCHFIIYYTKTEV